MIEEIPIEEARELFRSGIAARLSHDPLCLIAKLLTRALVDIDA